METNKLFFDPVELHQQSHTDVCQFKILLNDLLI